MSTPSGAISQGTPSENFVRDPLTVGVLTLLAPVYSWWWLWHVFRLAKREQFPRARSFWSIFLPIYNYVAFWGLFSDLYQRMEPGDRGRFSPRGALALVVVANLLAGMAALSRAPYNLPFLLGSFAFQAGMAYRVQTALNAYTLRRYPRQPAQGLGFGEVAAVILGVTLLGLDVLGATRASATRSQATITASETPIPTATPTPLTVASPFPATGDGFTVTTDPANWIGRGNGVTYDRQDAHFIVESTDPRIEFKVQYSEVTSWDIAFAPPAGQTLHVGTYINAGDGTVSSQNTPGLSVSGIGRSCTEVGGSFTITAIQVNDYGQLMLFDATFVQHCDRPDGPALTGRIRYVNQ